MWRDYAKKPHSQHDISRHPDEFAARMVQVNMAMKIIGYYLGYRDC